MNIINIRKKPEYMDDAIEFFSEVWENEKIYQDCISHSIDAKSPLPIWYLLMDEEEDEIVGCAGLITNDFISRMDLCPWLCALYIEEEYRGKNLGRLLIEQIKKDTAEMCMDKLYLCTDLDGYYEKYDFICIGEGYHPWGESSKIYEAKLK